MSDSDKVKPEIKRPVPVKVQKASQRQYSEVFPVDIDPGVTGNDRTTIEEGLAFANVLVATAGSGIDDLFELRAKLAEREVELGGIVGLGGAGGITYNILNKHTHKVVPEVVLRVDTKDMVPPLEKPNPGFIRSVLREEAGRYAANIVPRGKKLEMPPELVAQVDVIRPALAALNADGLLERVHDLEFNQFMAVEGISIPQATDLGIIKAVNSGFRFKGIDDFARGMKVRAEEIHNTVTPPNEMRRLLAEQQTVHEKCEAAVDRAGICLGVMPDTVDRNPKLTVAVGQMVGVSVAGDS